MRDAGSSALCASLKKKKKRGKVFGPIATCGFNYSRWTILRIGGWVDGGLVVHYLSLDNVWPLKDSSYLSQGLKTAMAICAIISRLKSSPASGHGGGEEGG